LEDKEESERIINAKVNLKIAGEVGKWKKLAQDDINWRTSI
jgi:hypothetical protein